MIFKTTIFFFILIKKKNKIFKSEKMEVFIPDRSSFFERQNIVRNTEGRPTFNGKTIVDKENVHDDTVNNKDVLPTAGVTLILDNYLYVTILPGVIRKLLYRFIDYGFTAKDISASGIVDEAKKMILTNMVIYNEFYAKYGLRYTISEVAENLFNKIAINIENTIQNIIMLDDKPSYRDTNSKVISVERDLTRFIPLGKGNEIPVLGYESNF